MWSKAVKAPNAHAFIRDGYETQGRMAEARTLNTGAYIPLLGLGTGSEDPLRYEEKKAAIATAIEVGYRHFDTASSYKSEGFLGDALQEAIRAGSVKREDLFITSKLRGDDAYPEGVLPALQKSLSELQLDYLDLYLIHLPIRCKKGTSSQPNADDLLPLDVEGTWRAMEDCAKKGLTRAIGVSNFSSKKIVDLLKFAEIPPAVNQVEMHPKWQQQKLRDVCNKANIHVSAWSPLGAPLQWWGTAAVLDDPIIKEIAVKHCRTPAQVALRWALDLGASALPKSFNRERMTENFQVFGWHLTDEDHHKVTLIKQKKNMDLSNLCNPVSGPYKTVEELWDGEI